MTNKKYELTTDDLKSLISNPILPESAKDYYRQKLEEILEKEDCRNKEREDE